MKYIHSPKRLFLLSFTLSLVIGISKAQDSRIITTAAPFLSIAPDSRAAGMGDAGAATSPDANATHWNAAKLAFIDKDYGASISYTPWLRQLVNDMSLAYLSGYYKLRKEDVVSVSLFYFDLGRIQFVNEQNNPIKDFNPQEYAVALNYSRRLSDKLGVSAGAKFIHSNLTGNVSADPNNTEARPGNTAAVDLGIFHTNEILVAGKPSTLNFGASITNLGAKISYSTSNQSDFIPTNLRLGTAFTTPLDDYNKLTFTLDANKLLVPTPPVRDGSRNILQGRDNNRSTLNGIFTSFNDAPGGTQEELRELMYSAGMEYWYDELFAIRAGYFHEHQTKGNRKYFTAGIGLRYNVMGLDIAYLVPVEQNNPLQNTVRFTLMVNFEKPKEKTSVTE
jgi:hypothetical protein